MLKKLDHWLIDSVFQRIVDYTQKSPAWLARQCVIGAVLMLGIHLAIHQDSLEKWFSLLVQMLFFGFIYLCTWSEPWFKWIGSCVWLRFMSASFVLLDLLIVVLLAFVLGINRFDEETLRLWLQAGFLYFAACSAPRPRVRRQTATRPALGY